MSPQPLIFFGVAASQLMLFDVPKLPFDQTSSLVHPSNGQS